MQNIFFYNQSMTHVGSGVLANQSLRRFILPRYCNDFLSENQLRSVNGFGRQSISSGSGDLLIKLYADIFSELEEVHSSRQLPLLVALLMLNTLALAFQAVHLYEDSKDLELP